VSDALNKLPKEKLTPNQQTDKKTLENLQILLKPFVTKYEEKTIENKTETYTVKS